MKRVIISLLFFSIFCFAIGCQKMNSTNDIIIFYGVSSYAMFGAEQSVIDDLVKKFDKLTFTKTDDKMDFMTTLRINFIADGKSIKKINVDKNGVFMLGGGTSHYKISSGTFDYEYVKNIYLNSQKN